MKIVYKPESGEGGGEWEFDPKRVRVSEAEMIERRYGSTWDAFAAGVQAGDARARRVLLWHLYRREHPAYRFEDVPDFYTGELVAEYSAQELGELLEAVKDAALPEDQRAALVASIRGELDKALDRENLDAVGKARSKRAG